MNKTMNFYNAFHILGTDKAAEIRHEFPEVLSKSDQTKYGKRIATECIKELLKNGDTNREMAETLGLSEGSVRFIVKSLPPIMKPENV